jgi:hypothetical protein
MIVNEYENRFQLQFLQIVVDCYWNTNKAKLAQRKNWRVFYYGFGS